MIFQISLPMKRNILNEKKEVLFVSMLSGSCYLTTVFLCYCFVSYPCLQQVLTVIHPKYEQSLICTKSEQSKDSCLLHLFWCDLTWCLYVNYDRLSLYSLQWTCRSLAMLLDSVWSVVSSLQPYHLYNKTVHNAAQATQRHCLSSESQASVDSLGHFQIRGCCHALCCGRLWTVAACVKSPKRNFNSQAQYHYLKIPQHGLCCSFSWFNMPHVTTHGRALRC